jgi:hypothetical protein
MKKESKMKSIEEGQTGPVVAESGRRSGCNGDRRDSKETHQLEGIELFDEEREQDEEQRRGTD